jgi:hypothetical protein
MTSIKPFSAAAAHVLSAAPKEFTQGIAAGGPGCVRPGPVGPFKPMPPPFPFGGDRDARVQGNQLHNIADGVRNGSITAQEAEKLLAQQQELAKATQAAKADGHVSFFERLKLNAMEAKAGRSIDQAKNNFDRDFFAGFDGSAQRQANQIDKIANGRTNGNITHSEASKLLGQQTQIADQRGNPENIFGNFMLDRAQDQASNDIHRHSRPGTQFNLRDLLLGGGLNG